MRKVLMLAALFGLVTPAAAFDDISGVLGRYQAEATQTLTDVCNEATDSAEQAIDELAFPGVEEPRLKVRESCDDVYRFGMENIEVGETMEEYYPHHRHHQYDPNE